MGDLTKDQEDQMLSCACFSASLWRVSALGTTSPFRSSATVRTSCPPGFPRSADETGAPPQEIQVILDGDAYPMILSWGVAGAGTYQFALPAADGCRAYYLHITDGDGNRYRYPGSGSFQTYGEGGR
jgi:hypothetical protein